MQEQNWAHCISKSAIIHTAPVPDRNSDCPQFMFANTCHGYGRTMYPARPIAKCSNLNSKCVLRTNCVIYGRAKMRRVSVSATPSQANTYSCIKLVFNCMSAKRLLATVNHIGYSSGPAAKRRGAWPKAISHKFHSEQEFIWFSIEIARTCERTIAGSNGHLFAAATVVVVVDL